MHPPPTRVPDIIGFDCTDEELFLSLEKMVDGYPSLPSNVVTDVNPYNYPPSNLPEGIWYLIRSKENGAIELGFWKVKGEASKLFSNSAITGWRTTLEFFEGQVPCERKTDWLMQEYWITQKGPGANSKIKEASSLCRVFLGGEQDLDDQKQKKVVGLQIASDTFNHSIESVVPNVNNGAGNGSTSEHGNRDDETGVLAVTGEIDYFSRGDYLELLDLDNPASPSSSSDNSSCLTMSSDEYFDSLALLREINSDSDINKGMEQKNESCKINVTVTFRPNEVVMVPASPGSFTSNEESRPPAEEIHGTESSLLGLIDDSKNRDNVGTNHNANYRDEGPSNSHDAGASSSHIPSQVGKGKGAKDRKRKLKKYMCFMPFYFLS